MKGTILSILTFAFLFCNSFTSSAQEKNIDLSGKWKFRKAGTQQWYDATVPGTVHTDLMKNKLIQDPYYRANEKDVQWVSDIGWEYMKEFNVSDTLFNRRHIELVFKGIDTWANIYLNDSLVIVSENMFKEWFADVRYQLHIGRNVLRIQFPAVKEENSARYKVLYNPLPGDERVVCRKAAYHFGWDWGPVLITSGLWKPVMLRTWNYNNLLGVQYIQRSLNDTSAEMTAVFTVLSGLGDTATLRVRNGKELLAEQRAPFKRGVNVVKVNFSVKNPIKWWCNGLGDQHLYTFDHEVIFAGRKEAFGSERIGLRTIQLVQDADSLGKSFYFKVNGVPVFMKGANYIPQDNFLPRVKDSSYRALIRSVKDANMNMLRVWGGGIYENEIFYDLCDENGILVWQDFMFANAMYPDTKEFYSNIQTEAIQNIVKLRHHPSIAVWCGNNEIDEGWQNWGWAKQYGYNPRDSTRIWLNYKLMFWNMLNDQVTKFDTMRPFVRTSPLIGWGRADSYKKGDSHYWGVWWGKEPFSKYNEKVGRFVSEYGFQGFPPIETIKQFTLPEDRKLGSDVMKAHQKHPEGYEIIEEYMQRDFRKPKDFESYVYVSQLLQAEGYKIAIEAHRRAKPYCMGTLYWQLNDCWPVVSWSSQDYYGRKKALHYTVKNAYKTVMISPFIENEKISIYVNSDSLQLIGATMKITLMDLAGKHLQDTSLTINIPANTSTIQAEFAKEKYLEGLSLNNVLMSVKIIAREKILAENVLYFVAPKDLALKSSVIKKNIKPVAGGYEISLTADVLSKGVYLSSPVKGEYSENYFDLLPGETRTIRFNTDIKGPAFATGLKIISLIDSYQQ